MQSHTITGVGLSGSYKSQDFQIYQASLQRSRFPDLTGLLTDHRSFVTFECDFIFTASFQACKVVCCDFSVVARNNCIQLQVSNCKMLEYLLKAGETSLHTLLFSQRNQLNHIKQELSKPCRPTPHLISADAESLRCTHESWAHNDPSFTKAAGG